jgi:hypothetical protein
VTDTARLTDALTHADQALAEVVAVYRDREMRAFHNLQDEAGHEWAFDVDQVQGIRETLARLPFAEHFRATP